MKLNDYCDFCEKVIIPYITQILDFAKQAGCQKCIKFNKRSIKRIYVNYQRKRDEIKSNYMEPPAKALDRHKVASCMLYAVLKSHVFRINKIKKELPLYVLMANEYLAVYIAINIVEQYKRDELGADSNYKLVFPITYHENDKENSSYLNNLCKGLYYINPKNINIFAYSTILFFMEKYTDIVCAENTIGQFKNTNLS